MYSNSSDNFTVGGTTAKVNPPADTLTLHLAEDAWRGNADFVLSIDGKAISTAQAVSALHSANAVQDFTFIGNFGAGSHTVGVTFTNDAYGGTSSTDRNLYVNGVSINGQSVTTGTTTMLSDGATNYTIVVTH